MPSREASDCGLEQENTTEYSSELAPGNCSLEKLNVWIRHFPEIVSTPILARSAWHASFIGERLVSRRLYMLIAMSNQLGAIAAVVISLSIGQLAIEYAEYQEPNSDAQAEEPLLGTPFTSRHPFGRRRTRSKPDSIFIHPRESNLARADAVALELGIAGDTELVQGNKADGQSWQLGKGRDVARQAFGGAHHPLLDSDANAFGIGDDDDT